MEGLPPAKSYLVHMSGSGLHLATWGQVDAKSNQIDMWLGFPAASLSRVGLKGLPRDAMLPISVQGNLKSPKVKWIECAQSPPANHKWKGILGPDAALRMWPQCCPTSEVPHLTVNTAPADQGSLVYSG